MMKILIVDDSPDKVSLLRSICEVALSRNANVDIATNGLEAREALSKKQYDLLVVDIALPLRSGDIPDPKGGMNLLVELERSSRFLKPGNVVALTGYADLRSEFESKFNNGVWSIDLYDPSDSGWRDRLQAKLTYLHASVQQMKAGAFGSEVCIITALASPELEAIRRLPWNFQPAEAFDTTSFMYSGFFQSGSKQYSVNALAAPRMGMIAASTLTTKIINILRPRILIMAGICAGLPGEAELGDVVLADPTWDWQMGKYTLENFEVQPDQIGVPVEISQRFGVLRDDRHALLSISDDFMGEKPNRVPTVRVGPMASGSAVIASGEMVASVKKQNRKLMAFDMEMYGVYSACRDAAAPRPIAFGLKGVCDHADHYKNDKYQAYASHVSARVICMFIEKYYAELAILQQN